MRVLLVTMFLFICLNASAAEFKWTPPAERADGSTLPASEIAGYKIYIASPAGNVLFADITDSSKTNHIDADAPLGVNYAMSTYNIYGQESELTSPQENLPAPPGVMVFTLTPGS